MQCPPPEGTEMLLQTYKVYAYKFLSGPDYLHFKQWIPFSLTWSTMLNLARKANIFTTLKKSHIGEKTPEINRDPTN